MTAAALDRVATRRVLAATCVSYTLVLLDASIVNVALTDIAQTFGSRAAGLQWIVNAYTLAFASLLMTGGTLGDRLGDRDVYIAGLAVFVAASALCGIAPTLPALAIARVLQGVGSAMLVPCSLALLNRAFPEPAARASAISLWMGCGGIAMASAADRRPADPSVRVAQPLLREPAARAGRHLARPLGRARRRGRRLAAFRLGQGRGHRCDRGPDRHVDRRPVARLALRLIIGGAVTSVVAWSAFIAVEARRREPMLPLAFFRNRLFAGSTFVSMASAFVFYGLLFVFSLFYRQVRGAARSIRGLRSCR